jgi:hypothetical protein
MEAAGATRKTTPHATIPIGPPPGNSGEVAHQGTSRTREGVQGLSGDGRRGGPDASCVTRKRVGICAVAALAVGGVAAAVGAGIAAAAGAFKDKPDITKQDVLRGHDGMNAANIFAGKLHDDAFLSAMSSVVQGEYTTMQYFGTSDVDKKLTVALWERPGGREDASLIEPDQKPLKQLIKDSDPKEPEVEHHVGTRVFEQGMRQMLASNGRPPLEEQTAADCLTALTGQPVEEFDIRAQGQGCAPSLMTRDKAKAFNAAAKGLEEGRPVLLTRTDDGVHEDAGVCDFRIGDAPGPKMVFSVREARPATNTSAASFVLKDPRGPSGEWPRDPSSPAHAKDRAIDEANPWIMTMDELELSKVSVGGKSPAGGAIEDHPTGGFVP